MRRLGLSLEVKEEFDNKQYLPIVSAPRVNAGKMRWSRRPPESAVGPLCGDLLSSIRLQGAWEHRLFKNLNLEEFC